MLCLTVLFTSHGVCEQYATLCPRAVLEPPVSVVSPSTASIRQDFPLPTGPMMMVIPRLIANVRPFNTVSESGDHAILASWKEINVSPWTAPDDRAASSTSLLTEPWYGTLEGLSADETRGTLRQKASMRSKHATPCTTLGTFWQKNSKGFVNRPMRDSAVKALVDVRELSFVMTAMML